MVVTLFQTLSYGEISGLYSFLSALFLGLLIFFLFSLSNKLFYSGLFITTLFLIVYIVNFYRFKLSGEFFTPRDFAMLKNLGAITTFGDDLRMEQNIIVVVFLFICIQFVFYYMTKATSVTARPRMISISFILLVFIPLLQHSIILYTPIPTSELYETKGVILGFSGLMIERKFPQLSEPGTEGGDVTFFEDLEEELLEKRKIKPTPSVKDPNVIVIMSEAFTDPSLWENATITKEVTPHFNALREKYPSGTMISSAMGGGTCNPEYEFLTGNPLFTLPDNIFPFEDPTSYIKDPYKRSLPYVFKQNGYKTIGVHPYQKTFFNRDTIYPRLGFDKFITMEDLEDPPIKGSYISDECFTDIIIKQIEETKDPAFIYGISMENHYGYFIEKFMIYGEFPDDVLDVNVFVAGLDEIERGYVISYLQGLYDADRALQQLTKYLEQSDEPTIVLFFGDHQPLLGPESHKVMYHLGQTFENEPFAYSGLESQLRMYQTPYLMWANFDLLPMEHEYLSAYHFGPLIIDQAGIRTNKYFEILGNTIDILPAGKHFLYVDKAGNVTKEPNDEMVLVIDLLRQLQYEYMHDMGDSQSQLVK